MMMDPYSSGAMGSPGSGTKIGGVMVGVVTDNKDPEKLGRVKLKLPIREGEQETDWARLATMMAGNDRGSLFIPEVGDEVLVAFHLGEIRQPYVLGMLWNKKQPSPKGDDTDKNNIRKIKTRSGHELTFDDDGKQGNVILKTSKGHIVTLDDKEDSIKINEQNDTNSIEIKGGSANEITIKSSSNTIQVNGKGEITISSAKSIKVSSVQVSIEASATLDLKASASLNIKSDGMVNIKGSMVKIN